MYRNIPGIALGVLLALVPVPAVQANDDDIIVYFTNQRSVSITVYVDGDYVCELAPGASCNTRMGGDGETKHGVHVVSGSQSYDDSFDLDECWGDDEGYTFTDEKAQFHCAGDEED
jgi:hypothetical protein